MVDNIAITAGSGTTVATDDVSSVHYQRVKVVWGPDGTVNDTDVASGKPVPVQLRGSAGGDVVKLEDDASGAADPGLPVLAVQKATPVNTGGTDGDYEFLQMAQGALWVQGPLTTKVSLSFARPADATAYTANDAVANATATASISAGVTTFTITRAVGTLKRVKIRKSDQTVATPTIRVWFWDATFSVGAGDNAAFTAPLADSLGFVDVAVTSAGTDDAVGWSNCDIPFVGATLYCLLQTLSAFTPASGETFTIELHYTPG